MKHSTKSKPWEVQIDNNQYLKVRAEAFDPTVIVGPPYRELYNCTTCGFGEPEHPAHIAKSALTFRVKCKFNLCWNEGPRNEDIGCLNWRYKDEFKSAKKERRRIEDEQLAGLIRADNSKNSKD